MRSVSGKSQFGSPVAITACKRLRASSGLTRNARATSVKCGARALSTHDVRMTW
jgi:hypothetical protein